MIIIKATSVYLEGFFFSSTHAIIVLINCADLEKDLLTFEPCLTALELYQLFMNMVYLRKSSISLIN